GRAGRPFGQNLATLVVAEPIDLFGPVEPDQIADEPDEAERTEYDEGPAPAIGAGNRRGDDGADGGTDEAARAPEHVGDAALARRHPFANDMAARGNRRRFERSHEETGRHQAGET